MTPDGAPPRRPWRSWAGIRPPRTRRPRRASRRGDETAERIAQMQYEYDRAVDQLKDGRQGLEQYRALVDRVGRQVATGKARLSDLEARTKAFLQAGQREGAAECALQMQRVQKDLAEN